MLDKTHKSPLDCKEIQPVHPKGDQSWVFIEGLMLNLKGEGLFVMTAFNTLCWTTVLWPGCPGCLMYSWVFAGERMNGKKIF